MSRQEEVTLSVSGGACYKPREGDLYTEEGARDGMYTETR
jgi:hypothetical protein